MPQTDALNILLFVGRAIQKHRKKEEKGLEKARFLHYMRHIFIFADQFKK